MVFMKRLVRTDLHGIRVVKHVLRYTGSGMQHI
jgi:hypothetical protein